MMRFLTYPILFTLAFLGTKYLGMDRTVLLFKKVGELRQRLPRLRRPPSLEEIGNRVVQGYRFLPLRIQCLDQSVVTWYLLNLYDYPAVLKIGMSLTPLRSHAWVVTGERTFGVIAGIADFQVVAEYEAWRAAK